MFDITGECAHMRPSSSGAYMRSMRVLDWPWKHVKNGSLPSDSLATSIRPRCAIMSLSVFAPVLSYGEGALEVRSSVTSGTQLASIPRMVLEFTMVGRVRKKAVLSLGADGAYTEASRLILPSTRVSHAMPLPFGRALMVDLTLASASWWLSFEFSVSIWLRGMSIAVPPRCIRGWSGTANR